jgi:hypothetical protein
MRLEELGQLKNPMTSSEIEPGYRVPPSISLGIGFSEGLL